MLSRNRLIQRLRSACSRRRLFTGDRGAIAASLIEIGVAMLAVGILTAGAVTTFTGFIDSASDTTARGRLTDAASTADQVYNWLRPGGARCFVGTACEAVSGSAATFATANEAAVTALQEAAGGQLTFAAWPLAADSQFFETANTIYVQVKADVAASGAAYTEGNEDTTNDHNGIAGDPTDGQWVRMAVRSDSGSTFCVIKVAHTAAPIYEGVGYMSVNSGGSDDPDTTAHCGGHVGVAADEELITAVSCVYGSAGSSTSQITTAAGEPGTDTNTDACHTQRSLGRPGDGVDVNP